MRRIAVIRFSSLGDIVLLGPALRGLRKRFPGDEITLFVNTPYRDIASLLPGDPVVVPVPRRGREFQKAIIPYALKSWDIVIDLQGSSRSEHLRRQFKGKLSTHYSPPRLRRFLRIYVRTRIGKFEPVPVRYIQSMSEIGVEDDGLGLSLRLPQLNADDPHDHIPLLNQHPYILVPGSKHGTKQWPGEHWKQLAEILSQSAPVLFVGILGELPDEVQPLLSTHDNIQDLTGKLSLTTLVQVLDTARCVISGDTGPMHMAIARKKPLVAMFGPTVEDFGFFPFRAPNTITLEKKLWCRPCSPHGATTCPLGHHRCMKNIIPEEVLEAVRKVEEIPSRKIAS